MGLLCCWILGCLCLRLLLLPLWTNHNLSVALRAFLWLLLWLLLHWILNCNIWLFCLWGLLDTIVIFNRWLGLLRLFGFWFCFLSVFSGLWLDYNWWLLFGLRVGGGLCGLGLLSWFIFDLRFLSWLFFNFGWLSWFFFNFG